MSAVTFPETLKHLNISSWEGTVDELINKLVNCNITTLGTIVIQLTDQDLIKFNQLKQLEILYESTYPNNCHKFETL